jgi:hypothetical protein
MSEEDKIGVVYKGVYADLATGLLDNKDEPLVGIQPGIYFWAKYLNVATREKRKI